MKKTRQNIALKSLEANTGQLDWLPKNPRQWTKDDLSMTVESIREDEDFLEDRPLLVVGYGDKFIVFAGNLRLTASRKLKLKDVPCVIYEPEDDVTDPQTIRRRALKDNGSFGSWDVDTLANQWDNEKAHFDDWGLRGVWSKEDQAAEEAAEEEQPTNLDATNVTEKPFVAKLTFDTDGILQQFIAKYRQQLIDEFGCTVNISGGAI